MGKDSSSDNEPRIKHGLQVIGAGLPRTSTFSLHLALETLGLTPCYHTISNYLPNARTHGALWLAAMREPSAPVRRKILAEVTKGCNGIVDGPGCFFVADWVEMYPDAKVVLGLRKNPEVWLKSVNATMGKLFGKGVMYWLCYFVPGIHFGFCMNNLWEMQAREKYGVSVKTEEFYEMHNKYIRSIVPNERLLEFQASDGFEPLARFLGKEVPRECYPHKNDSNAANMFIRSFVVYGVGVWIIVLVCGWVAVRALIGVLFSA